MSRPVLKPLTPDPNVIQLQKLLLANGYTDGGMRATGLFDTATQRNVEVFQLQHLDAHGQPLVADGVVGPKTWWALENPSGGAQRSHLASLVPDGLTDERRQLLELLIAEHAKPVAEEPDGSNRSEDIDGYWGNTGLVGHPWCCAFVSWALYEVMGEYPISGRHHVAVQPMWRAAKLAGLEAPRPRPGDVFVQIRSGGRGHTGFVVGVSEDDREIFTCEGNCGNRLKRGKRRREHIEHFIDPFQDGQGLDFERGDPEFARAAAVAVDEADDR